MCEKCSMDQLHPTPPSRRSVVMFAASTLGLMLTGTANAKEAKAPKVEVSAVSLLDETGNLYKVP